MQTAGCGGCQATQTDAGNSASLLSDRSHTSSSTDVIAPACRHWRGQRVCMPARGGASTTPVAPRVGTARPFVCPSCLASFADRATLVRHIRVHTGDRPYHCPLCSRAFTQSGNLTRHVRAKHPSSVVNGNRDKHPSASAAPVAISNALASLSAGCQPYRNS